MWQLVCLHELQAVIAHITPDWQHYVSLFVCSLYLSTISFTIYTIFKKSFYRLIDTLSTLISIVTKFWHLNVHHFYVENA